MITALPFSGKTLFLWLTLILSFVLCLWFQHTLILYVSALGALLILSVLLLRHYFPAALVETVVNQQPRTTPTKSVIFILGPCAASWFARSTDEEATRFTHDTVWMLAPRPDTLEKRLAYIAAHHPDTRVMAFFPLLPDGFATPDIMEQQLRRWCHSFASLRLDTPLPFAFALYARLSQQRWRQDPDRAIWLGEVSLEQQTRYRLDECIEQVRQALQQQITSGDRFTVQRSVMAQSLFLWLAETGLSDTLQCIFNSLPLSLTGMTLADYGEGFTRHGAWSYWSEERYKIIPDLAASLAIPPLPLIYQHVTEINVKQRRTPFRWRWGPLAVALLLAVSMFFSFAREKNHVSHIQQRIAQLTDIRHFFPKQKLRALTELANEQDYFFRCSDNFSVWDWGFSSCGQLLPQVNQDIRHYQKTVAQTPFWSLPLFASGSAALPQAAEEKLRLILPLIMDNQTTRYLLLGHADNTGSPQKNMALSIQRAVSVRDWIIGHTSLTRDNFVVRGVGDASPVAEEQTGKEQAQNRRVEIIPLTTTQLID